MNNTCIYVYIFTIFRAVPNLVLLISTPVTLPLNVSYVLPLFGGLGLVCGGLSAEEEEDESELLDVIEGSIWGAWVGR